MSCSGPAGLVSGEHCCGAVADEPATAPQQYSCKRRSARFEVVQSRRRRLHTRAFYWLKAATTAFTFKTLHLMGIDLTVSSCEIGTPTQLS